MGYKGVEFVETGVNAGYSVQDEAQLLGFVTNDFVDPDRLKRWFRPDGWFEQVDVSVEGMPGFRGVPPDAAPNLKVGQIAVVSEGADRFAEFRRMVSTVIQPDPKRSLRVGFVAADAILELPGMPNLIRELGERDIAAVMSFPNVQVGALALPRSVEAKLKPGQLFEPLPCDPDQPAELDINVGFVLGLDEEGDAVRRVGVIFDAPTVEHSLRAQHLAGRVPDFPVAQVVNQLNNSHLARQNRRGA